MSNTYDEVYGRGWAFPPVFSPEDGVSMVAGAEDVRQSLRILFSTLPGERIMRREYGCDLNQFMFANISAGLMTSMKAIIADSVLNCEPRAEVTEVDFRHNATALNELQIQVTYRLRGSDTPQQFSGELDLLNGWGGMS
ncbi:GPW/gp25 family protein [Burkholderia ubonensis]|uniref:GPW/gp25 family protein n=1 Tax=Burkholderia ubonensis TaxID=101571 RepID=UPI00075E3AF4|nr:GPW/gp25 family protein [Burkholderia ubonensis]KVN28367.1 phage baseplate protein [Burkholderia ubonensis]